MNEDLHSLTGEGLLCVSRLISTDCKTLES